MSEQEKTPTPISRRDLLKLSGAATAGILLASCQGATPAPKVEATEAVSKTQPTSAPKSVTGKVTIMHQRNELSEDQQKQFETANPGITVEFIQADQTRFFAMFAAGTPPDLYRLQAPSIPQFLARKLLYDLTPYFETSQLTKIDDLSPANDYYKANSPLEIGKGKLYGMVKDFSPDFTVFIYKPIFEANGVAIPDDTKPLSYDEVVDLSKKTTKFEGDRLVSQGYGYEKGWIDRIWMAMLAEKDQKLYTDGFDKVVISGNEEAKKIVQYYFELAKEKLTDSPINPSPNGWFGTDFTSGILAMAQYGYWFSAMAESDTTKGKVMMLPAPTWAGQHRDCTMTATGMIMTSASKAPDAAWKLFEWYNGDQPSIERAKSGWGVPGLKSQYALMPTESDYQKQVQKVLQGELSLNTPPIQFNPFIGETVVADSWSKNSDIALKGDATFDEMVATIEKEVNDAIKDGIDRIMG